MANVTLSIDDDLLRTVRKIAVDRDTSVNQMVREYLEQVAIEARQSGQQLARRFAESVQRTGLRSGEITWKREDLHDREALR